MLTPPKRVWDELWRYRDLASANLVAYAISKRDLPLVQYLIKTAREYGIEQLAAIGNRADNTGLLGNRVRSAVLVTPINFSFALKKGFTEIAGELIRSTGVDLPLDHLVKESGVTETEMPIVSYRVH